MNSKKRALVLLSVLCSLAQTQTPANAQAEPLVGLAYRLIPMVLPVVLTAVPMIPLMIKQAVVEMPKPHLLHRKGAEKETPSNQPTPEEAAMPPQPKFQPKETPAVPVERTAVAPVRRPRAADNSDWMMDDEIVEASSQTQQVAEPEPAPRREAPREKPVKYRTTESVHSELIKPEASGTAAGATRESSEGASTESQSATVKNSDADAAPTIMMKVAE